MKTLLTNARIVTDGAIFDKTDVLIEEGKIVAVDTAGLFAADEVIDLRGNYLAPGFIDLHCHGGDGFEFIDATEEAFLKTCAIHAAHGTRVLYPTISATDFETMYRVLETAEKIIPECPLEIPGIHLEGPYLSLEMSGGQDPAYIKAPDEAEYEPILERFGHLIARWTYAPERDDGRFLAALNRHGITPAIGHSAAQYEHILPAYENGCRLVTHLYSCTSTITRHGGFRRLGVIESTYLLDGMYAEAIADGCHLPADLLKLIIKLKGADRVCLITDAIRFGGVNATAPLLGGTQSMPYIIEDGVAKLADRSAFAGSIATTEDLLQRSVKAGIALADVVKMMTQTPAEAMGLSSKGRIAPGYDAQFTVFDSDLNIRKEFSNCCS